MSDAPERITAWGDQATLGVVYKAGPRPMQNMVPFRATEYTRADLSDALLREAVAWLADFAEAKFDAVQTHRASHPADEPDPVTDAETVWAYQADARPTLAKLRQHLEDNHAK